MKKYNQQKVEVLAEEAAARAALSDAEEVAGVASSPSEMWDVLERYEACARFYTAQPGIECDIAEVTVWLLEISVASHKTRVEKKRLLETAC